MTQFTVSEDESIGSHCSVTKRREMLSFVATWIELEVIVLGEGRQTQKDRWLRVLIHRWGLESWSYGRMEWDGGCWSLGGDRVGGMEGGGLGC